MLNLFDVCDSACSILHAFGVRRVFRIYLLEGDDIPLDVEFISSPAERQVSTTKKQQLHDVTSPCWLVKRAGDTSESSLFGLCCIRLSPNPQTGVCN